MLLGSCAHFQPLLPGSYAYKFLPKQVSSDQVLVMFANKCFISVAVSQFLMKGWSEGSWGGTIKLKLISHYLVIQLVYIQ